MNNPVSRPPGYRGRFLTDLAARSAYSEGAGPLRIVPAAVALPNDVEDVVALIRHASDTGAALVPRGAGSGMPGGNVGRGIVVDLRQFVRPLFVSARESANVGAGVTHAEVEGVASHFGLRLPPDPSSGAFCTIGGMVATNAAGPRSLRAGSVRRWVRGIEMVSADGEVGWLGRAKYRRPPARRSIAQVVSRRSLVERFRLESRFDQDARPAIAAAANQARASFPATRKNSSGYALDHYLASGDLVDLMIGSEGTLGIVTRVELTLELLPQATAGVLLALDDLSSLGDIVQHLRALDPSVLELMDRTLLDLAGEAVPVPRKGVEAILLAEFERTSPAAARDAVAQAVSGTARWCAYAETALTDEDRKRLWAVRHAASPALARLSETRRSLQVIEDGCVPVEALGTYIAGVREAAHAAGIDVVAFGHAGDGHLHVNALVPADGDPAANLTALLERVTALLVELGGTTSGEHGDGRLRAPLLEQIYGPETLGLFRRIKTAFDPAGVFNPGVILAEPDAQPLADLKIGPRAAPIPDEIAGGLRDMERTAGWRQCPLDLPGVAATDDPGVAPRDDH